jgi:hypothetical protein
MENSIGERGHGDIPPHVSPARWPEQNSPCLPSGILNDSHKNFLSDTVPACPKPASYHHLKTGDL